MSKSDDTISRQDALEAFGLSENTRKYGGDHSRYDTRMLYEIQDVLESLPSAEPKTGKWVKVIDEETPNVTKWHYECDQCGAGRWEKGQRYCQNCGAKMLGEDGDHNA